jgi:O-succinylbenzoic acid--CoA ligase
MLNDFIVLDGVSNGYLQQIKAFIDEWQNENETIIAGTSGSTGPSKRIALNKEQVRNSANGTSNFFNFKAGENLLLNLSPDTIAGKLQIVRAFENNMNLIIAPLTGNPLLVDCEHHIDFAAFVPAQVKSILGEEISKTKLNGIKNVIIGGAPLTPAVEVELNYLNCKSYASFGMTETITHFALRLLGTPIYKCLDNYTISVDENSCLIVNPNNVVLKELHTTDVIDYIDEKRFKWLGRLDNVINSGGIKIHPEKIEKMLVHLLPDNRFYISSKKDDTYGEVAVLVVEGSGVEETILSDAKESLPRHKAPKELIILPKFEMTPSQKVIRKKF